MHHQARKSVIAAGYHSGEMASENNIELEDAYQPKK